MTDTYTLIERALNYLCDHWEDQPELIDLADHVGMSEYHLQRLFTKWAGISPKKFLSQLTLDQARRRLDENQSILDAALDSGLSGPSRLHDLFVTYEAMTPGEYKRKGAGVEIRYGWVSSPFGEMLLMATDRGLCGLAFEDERGRAGCFEDMARRWPDAHMVEDSSLARSYADRIFGGDSARASDGDTDLNIILKGTPFQVKVWEALMSLPEGSVTTYGQLAKSVGIRSGGAQAVGSAVGANPLAWLIPCHRVIRSNGLLGGYRWGLPRKLAMLGWEVSHGSTDQISA